MSAARAVFANFQAVKQSPTHAVKTSPKSTGKLDLIAVITKTHGKIKVYVF